MNLHCYLFDPNNGRLLKVWWWCPHCKVYFKKCIEVCPCCGQDGTPSMETDYPTPRLVKWSDGWNRMRAGDSMGTFVLEKIDNE